MTMPIAKTTCRTPVEAYLVHLIARDGSVTTKRYQAEIFGWDYPGDGGGFGIYLDGDPSGDFDACAASTRHRLKRGGGEAFRSITGLQSVDAILWYPEEDKSLPMILSTYDRELRLGGEETDYGANSTAIAAADGTLSSALDAVSRRLMSTAGELKGATVDRSKSRPDQLTLHEVFASTDPTGYWIQTWEGQSDPYSAFILPLEPPEWGDLVLKKISVSGEHDLGCAYASVWRRDGSASLGEAGEKEMFRVLAVDGTSRVPRQAL